ncbi:RecT family recombinase [Humibacter ginsenosidimutans]|uniref:Recombinase RecT n=1 Tax=Humibacter ginsenosidimutans TaxID=2599293 RepID=A0A5B8M5C3_9MICO|nr:RecT family recombinase [Humibacter ginsenosidimutans]QDZ15807.1 recombinase RecT [Humibacter ginsenosidimutans]
MSGEVTLLPDNGDVTSWSEAEKAIVEAAGLVFTHTYGDREGQREAAPRPVVEKFLSLARRTGLDPLARQIYCIGRLSKGRVEWSVQTGIDGFRVVADRSRRYAGQDPVLWLTEKGEWVDAFVPSLHGTRPLAARATVYRSDWPRPLVAIAEWGAYVQTKRDGNPNEVWSKQGPGQLAKCAEALALRKAFPQDLSGIYTSDEMAAAEVDEAQVTPARDWKGMIAAASTHEDVEDIIDRCDDAGELTDAVRTAALTRHGMLGRDEGPVEAPDDDAVDDAGPAYITPGLQPTEDDDVDEAEFERISAQEYADAVARGEVLADE